jgi:hypothetical protein
VAPTAGVAALDRIAALNHIPLAPCRLCHPLIVARPITSERTRLATMLVAFAAVSALTIVETFVAVIILPAVATIGILIHVGWVMRRGGGMLMAISSVLSIAAAVMALQIYYAMARGAWPTYVGFILTGVAGVFALVQWFTAPWD